MSMHNGGRVFYRNIETGEQGWRSVLKIETRFNWLAHQCGEKFAREKLSAMRFFEDPSMSAPIALEFQENAGHFRVYRPDLAAKQGAAPGNAA